ncbi:hypothetical protein QQ054_01080 [Oscillatoria amoena NRMC-F 0135]|nr:hypothetical protein [Oscillatoria amoena NRMC-F 0135]
MQITWTSNLTEQDAKNIFNQIEKQEKMIINGFVFTMVLIAIVFAMLIYLMIKN